MTLLSGILGINHASATATDATLFAQAEGDVALGNIATHSNAMDLAASRLDRLMGAAEAIEAINPQSKDARLMARMHLATAMSDCDLDDSDAANLTSGLESDDVEAGLEAWSSIKDFVNSIIEFIQKQWKKLKVWVAKYWNKYFGDVERLQKAWLKIKEDAKKKQTGYTLEKSAKHTFERSADQFHADDKLLKGTDLEAEVKKYTELATNIGKLVDGATGDLEFDSSDYLTSDGALVSDYEGTGPADLVEDLGTDSFKFSSYTKKNTDVPSIENAISTSGPLAGNVAMFYCVANASKDVVEILKSTRVVITNPKKNAVAEKKANLDLLGAGEIESLADANLDLLVEVIGIKRNKAIKDVENVLDKADKALDKWKKETPDSDATPKQRADFRQAVKIVTETFSVGRRIGITTPIDFCGQARIVSAAYLEFAKKSLNAMKKDD